MAVQFRAANFRMGVWPAVFQIVWIGGSQVQVASEEVVGLCVSDRPGIRHRANSAVLAAKGTRPNPDELGLVAVN